ncbi:probable tubulin polyglutamylase ttll-15 [Euwallacea similis]|uniref:probable tubulin polyglutamylase ttll-15 n=1 Tax=Euwallacea similis TaxID=1736056 RepID=UPI00344E500B
MSVGIGYFSLSPKKMRDKDDDKTQSCEENCEEEKKESDKVKLKNKVELIPLIEQLFTTYWGLSILFGGVSMLTIFLIAADECRQCFNKTAKFDGNTPPTRTKTFWTYGKNSQGGHLKEVYTVLERMGYTLKEGSNDGDWDLLWAHDYPFRVLQSELRQLKPHQKINHLPGCGYITNKVDLATSGLDYIPPAFKLPEHKEQLLEYSRTHSNRTFVQKNNDHRNIKIEKLSNIDMEKSGTFVQEFVDKPLLVSGHKFDIGIYTIVTSIDPLRVYIYNGEALLRFCPTKYYPFDPTNLDKYVVGDDYLPIWEIPALDYYYNKLGFGMRESLNAHLRRQGKDPSVIWSQIEDSIRTVMLAKESLIADVLKRYKHKRNFFEMMRFDFVVDEDFKIYLLEANMSPNLSSAHFPPNRLLYQQLLYNVLGLVGVGERVQKNSLEMRSKEEETMIVSDKHLATYPEKCDSQLCRSSCVSPECQLCKPCLSIETRRYLIEAFKEHLHRGDCKRVFPPVETREEATKPVDEKYSAENQLHYMWFKGKCILDSTWC